MKNNCSCRKHFIHKPWKDTSGRWFYRLFGIWQCLKCRKRWESAYTWVSKHNWDTRLTFREYQLTDYYQQACKSCRNKINKVIHLQGFCQSEEEREIRPHLADLCKRCLQGDYCTESKYRF